MNYSKRFVNASRRTAMALAMSFVLAAPQTFAAQSSEKVGVVDSGKILERLPETKQAEAGMKAFVGPLQQELERMQQNYQKAVLAYRQQAGSMTKPARDQKEKELTLQGQAIEKYQQEKFGRGGVVDRKQQELLSPIRQKVLSSIESMAQKEGYGMIIEKNVSLFVTPELDLTFKVMNQLNIK
ncbi:MAG: OmpH family outer membrane protein [Chlorobiaceae bacterium]|nr:OmpH family outer membrane protein [Chlorobiaceae bacterium]NTV61250.1 OmpH family outer membrane protein [Chlorobiaceae bacterium]